MQRAVLIHAGRPHAEHKGGSLAIAVLLKADSAIVPSSDGQTVTMHPYLPSVQSLPVLLLLSEGSSAGATLGSMSALSSSAAILGDVNNDGKLDVSDVVTLNKFLAGEGVLSNYNVADTNANGIIDGVDSTILMAFLVHEINRLPHTTG